MADGLWVVGCGGSRGGQHSGATSPSQKDPTWLKENVQGTCFCFLLQTMADDLKMSYWIMGFENFYWDKVKRSFLLPVSHMSLCDTFDCQSVFLLNSKLGYNVRGHLEKYTWNPFQIKHLIILTYLVIALVQLKLEEYCCGTRSVSQRQQIKEISIKYNSIASCKNKDNITVF